MAEATQKITPRPIGAGVEAFTTFYPVPGLGLVPINAFLLRSEQPVLVDTGPVVLAGAYLEAIQSTIDPSDLRWIWLTHADPDHIGCLRELLDLAPQARLVTTFLGLGKLGLYGPLPPERAYLVNPGQQLDVGDRALLAMRPPTYDAPETTGFFDTRTGTLFSADSFGALLSAPAERANDLTAKALRDGIVTWATIDSPWLSATDPAAHDAGLAAIRDMAPPVVLSSHLPPAFGMTDVLVDVMRAARTAPPWVGPDQKALTELLASAPPAAARPAERIGA